MIFKQVLTKTSRVRKLNVKLRILLGKLKFCSPLNSCRPSAKKAVLPISAKTPNGNGCKKGKTVIVSTHDQEIRKLADLVVCLENGKLASQE